MRAGARERLAGGSGCTKQYFGQLALRIPESVGERETHDPIVKAVELRLGMADTVGQDCLPEAVIEQRRRTAAVEDQIDKLVYQRYGLTEAEVALVESGTALGQRRDKSVPTEQGSVGRLLLRNRP